MKLQTIIESTQKINETVTLNGWVDTKRDHGKITFLDLRDRTGIVQCVFGGKMPDVTPESVLQITGLVKNRPEKMINTEMETGSIELEITDYTVVNKSSELPIPVNTDGREINEEMRLRYRYLDLRRERMRSIMKLRSDYTRAMREALHKRDFQEVETPILTKSTKEGSRDFVVPSRHHAGKFYALPQSPQQYKQLLMTAGVERYFQFARCIRDEDLRADRGYEHTQVDLEVSFVNREENMQLIEEIVVEAITAVGGKIKEVPFPRIDYQEAMEKYGADKFDMRTEEDKENGILAFAWVINFPFFKKVDSEDAAEVQDGKSGWTFTHNPFSSPLPEHLEWHLAGQNIEQILTTQYDLVCNGYEAGGGSIRAHDPAVLEATYRIMGYSEQETEENVGHMLEAFRLGTPPHGGIALGLDRHIMILAGESSLKEAIPFPMTSSGKTAVMDAPSALDPEQLEELHVSVIETDSEEA
ncbi:aspartate--tRNA ligase [candidate division WWE3 bacterium]|uniref:Aspartate--tRNA ligase n=1 Tax=candidate division WWE3 bacterium TaxID=2053526 RepID=A0A955RPZ6_UNCKA|nr:aspartate--tRNA ligase [candidate division WWE3 bacterium]